MNLINYKHVPSHDSCLLLSRFSSCVCLAFLFPMFRGIRGIPGSYFFHVSRTWWSWRIWPSKESCPSTTVSWRTEQPPMKNRVVYPSHNQLSCWLHTLSSPISPKLICKLYKISPQIAFTYSMFKFTVYINSIRSFSPSPSRCNGLSAFKGSDFSVAQVPTEFSEQVTLFRALGLSHCFWRCNTLQPHVLLFLINKSVSRCSSLRSY